MEDSLDVTTMFFQSLLTNDIEYRQDNLFGFNFPCCETRLEMVPLNALWNSGNKSRVASCGRYKYYPRFWSYCKWYTGYRGVDRKWPSIFFPDRANSLEDEDMWVVIDMLIDTDMYLLRFVLLLGSSVILMFLQACSIFLSLFLNILSLEVLCNAILAVDLCRRVLWALGTMFDTYPICGLRRACWNNKKIWKGGGQRYAFYHKTSAADVSKRPPESQLCKTVGPLI